MLLLVYNLESIPFMEQGVFGTCQRPRQSKTGALRAPNHIQNFYVMRRKRTTGWRHTRVILLKSSIQKLDFRPRRGFHGSIT